MEDWHFYVVLAIVIALFSNSFYMLSSSGKNDEVIQNIRVASIITIIAMLLFGAVAFWYFTANPQYGYPYLLVTNTLALVFSAGAMAVSTINVQWVA